MFASTCLLVNKADLLGLLLELPELESEEDSDTLGVFEALRERCTLSDLDGRLVISRDSEGDTARVSEEVTDTEADSDADIEAAADGECEAEIVIDNETVAVWLAVGDSGTAERETDTEEDAESDNDRD